jgi:prepilin-type N-terminal cleavage/methylation domain-containing protein
MKKFRGFTLVELLISSSISLVLMITVYSAFHTGIFGYRDIEDRILAYQAARLILERINLDLRNSFAYSEEETRFTGSGNEIGFFALVDTFSQNNSSKDYAFLSYQVQDNRLTRLCRKNKNSLNEKLEIQPEEMADGLGSLSFEYGFLDPTDKSLKFKDTWATKSDAENERKTFPAAVRVKLTLGEKVNQDFQRTVYLQ